MPNTARPPSRISTGFPLDYDGFVNLPRLDAKDIQNVQNVYKDEGLDFRINAGSAAVDRGLVLLDITDNFCGKALDLGALANRQASPHYGPRH